MILHVEKMQFGEDRVKNKGRREGQCKRLRQVVNCMWMIKRVKATARGWLC